MPITHGMSKTRQYEIWCGMKKRCEKPSSAAYKWYGGRGIKVCERWSKSFQSFIDDMGFPPEGLQIDRINNDGDYEPGNCRWVTSKQNNGNRRSNVVITLYDESRTITEWGKELKVPAPTLFSRLYAGYEPVQILFGKHAKRILAT